MIPWARRFASTLLVALCLTSPAQASPSRVVVVQSANESQIVNQATTRLRAELAASGFEVITLDRAPGVTPRDAVEDIGLNPVATLSIVSTEKGAAVDVWVADHLTGKTLVRRVDVDSQAAPSAPKVLAIRAVELLRASLLEADRAPRASPGPPIPADVARWMEVPSAAPAPPPSPIDSPPPLLPPAAPAPPFVLPPVAPARPFVLPPAAPTRPFVPPALAAERSPPLPASSSPRWTPPRPPIISPSPRAAPPGRFAFELGAAMIHHLDGDLPSFGPELRLSYHAAPRWALALDVVGPAFTWARQRSAGELTPREELAVAEIAFTPLLRGPVMPLVSLGIGADHAHISASAEAPYQAHSSDVLSFVTTAGAAAQIEIAPRVALHLGVRVFCAFPGALFRIAGEDVGRIGLMNLASSLGVVVTP